jgi:HK97 family phage major capsid protein
MNLDALSRDLAAKRDAARTTYAAATKAAEKDNRDLTADERQSVQALIDEANAIKAKLDRAETDAAMGRTIEGLVAPTRPTGDKALSREALALAAGRPDTSAAFANGRLLSMGEQFVASETYDFFKKGHHRSSAAWRSPSLELHDHRSLGVSWQQYAATLTEDPTSGGKLVVPDYRPGIVPLLLRRRVVADLIAPGTTASNLITYMVEKTFTNASDTVLEGAAKPESALTFDAISDPVRKIAHWLPVTEEMLEDVAQIQSYIDARLRLGIDLTEEDQLLNGTTVAPDIIGIRNRVGLAALVDGTGKPIPDAIYTQIMAIFNTAFLMPDGVIMNPADWSKVQLSKTTTGEYIGSGPFTDAQSPVLWGLPVAVTPVMTAGQALVGAFRAAAQIFRRGGVRVEASNSHQDFFIKNLVAIRAEERLALSVYRPGAFGEVHNLGA